ncbi:isocitrate/isopropylmalate family dehydrogenase, partial [Synechococcus sp. AH-707-B22]|nr:isocitrate/isopropylmalate family dehydrogenase [Synechococcus sp. AH-707-B22]
MSSLEPASINTNRSTPNTAGTLSMKEVINARSLAHAATAQTHWVFTIDRAWSLTENFGQPPPSHKLAKSKMPPGSDPSMAQFEKLTAPIKGTAIRFENGQPVVGNDPIIPFIRGDGTGVDIWPATQKVLDAAVAQAYKGEKTIEWFKVYAGDEACDLYGTYQYLPEDTLEAIRSFGVAIKGPLTTPVGG